MPAIHIRRVDDAVIALLKERAAAHHRSLEGEVREILEQAAQRRPRSRRGQRRRLRLKTVAVKSNATFSRDEIYADDAR